MAPKGKKGKKGGNDDWEAELGESIAPAAASPDAAANGDANGDDESAGGGGLMNLMRKKKEKRKKQGLSEDFVEGETAPGAEPESTEPPLYAKAPEEATMDDEFALPEKKGKGGKQQQQQQKQDAGADDDETGEGGRMLTKAEKEKLKKEREKQRKKEQVSLIFPSLSRSLLTLQSAIGGKEEGHRSS